MSFLFKFIIRIVLSGAALYVADTYVAGFTLLPLETEFPGLLKGYESLMLAALVLATLNTFLRPIFRLITAPLVWITFGLFNIVIYMATLKIAEIFLPQIEIADLWTLFIVAVIVGFANAIL